jgi:hypothetical protein
MSLLKDRPPIAMIGGAIVIICLVAIGLYVFMNNSTSTGTPATGTLPAATPHNNATTGRPQAELASNVTGPAGGNYLNLTEGTATKIFLINSGIRYGTFDEDVNWPPAPGGYLAKTGDPCIIVNGTIRNDYDADYYIGLTANAYNSSGEKAGTIVNVGGSHPWFAFTTTHTQSKGTDTFQIYIKYNGTDIKSYDIYAAFMPGPSPPP